MGVKERRKAEGCEKGKGEKGNHWGEMGKLRRI